MFTRYDDDLNQILQYTPSDALNKLSEWSAGFGMPHTTTVVSTVGLGIVVGGIWVLAWLLNRPTKVEGSVAKEFRTIRVKALLADGITEFVEDAVFNHKLTRDEARDIYNKIGYSFTMLDLLPKRRKPDKLNKNQIAGLKAKIKERSPQLISKVKPTVATNVVVMRPKMSGKLGRRSS